MNIIFTIPLHDSTGEAMIMAFARETGWNPKPEEPKDFDAALKWAHQKLIEFIQTPVISHNSRLAAQAAIIAAKEQTMRAMEGLKSTLTIQ